MSCCAVAQVQYDKNHCDCVTLPTHDLLTEKVTLTLAAAPVANLVAAGTILSLDTLAPNVYKLPSVLADLTDTVKRPVVLLCKVSIDPTALPAPVYPMTVEVMVAKRADLQSHKLVYPVGFTDANKQAAKTILESVGLNPVVVLPAPTH